MVMGSGMRGVSLLCALQLNKIRSGNRIVTGVSPRVAAEYAAQSEPRAFDSTMFLQRLDGILRAGRGVAARRRKVRRDRTLIEPYNQYENLLHLQPITKVTMNK